jgi:pimeloyl-ACP methyl ester carboxylesterase
MSVQTRRGEVLSSTHVGAHGSVTVTARLARRAGVDAAVRPVATVGFLHGLGASHPVWDRLVAGLPEDVEAWTFGLPWDATQGYAWALAPEPRVWLERAVGLLPTPPDVLVAHSFGANVLLDHVVAHGATGLDGLVLLSPFYRPSPDAFSWAVISHYLNDFTDLLAAGIAARSGAAPSPDVLAAMAEKVRDRISPYGWMRFFELFTATPTLDLAAVTVPCLILGGDRDTASYPEDNRNLARRLRRGSVEILAHTGHFAMVDDPARVGALVGDFLRSRRHD